MSVIQFNVSNIKKWSRAYGYPRIESVKKERRVTKFVSYSIPCIKHQELVKGLPVMQPRGLIRSPHLPGSVWASVTLIPARSAWLAPLMVIKLHKHSGIDLITFLSGLQQLSGGFWSLFRKFKQGWSWFRHSCCWTWPWFWLTKQENISIAIEIPHTVTNFIFFSFITTKIFALWLNYWWTTLQVFMYIYSVFFSMLELIGESWWSNRRNSRWIK